MQLIYETDYLAHHGILGQKWGIRRYQNPDGSLTSAGLKRYAKISKKLEKANEKLTKYAIKDDKKKRKYATRAARNKRKADKLMNKSLNGWFISDNKRAKLYVKSKKKEAKANRLQSKADRYEANKKKAQTYVNKYNRILSDVSESQMAQGEAYVNTFY